MAGLGGGVSPWMEREHTIESKRVERKAANFCPAVVTGRVSEKDMEDGGVRIVLDAWEEGLPVTDAAVRAAVKYSLAEFQKVAPGTSVEIRVPPYAVIQAIEGPRHRRGTPPATVEMDAPAWLALVDGRSQWDEEVARGAIMASGVRSNLSEYLPLWRSEAYG